MSQKSRTTRNRKVNLTMPVASSHASMPSTTTLTRSIWTKEVYCKSSGIRSKTNHQQIAHPTLKTTKISKMYTRDSRHKVKVMPPHSKVMWSITSLPMLSIRTRSSSNWTAPRKAQSSSKKMLMTSCAQASRKSRKSWRMERFPSHWAWWHSMQDLENLPMSKDVSGIFEAT